MDANRRDFIKISLAGGAAASFFGFDLAPAYAQLQELKIARAQETRSIYVRIARWDVESLFIRSEITPRM